MTPAQKERLAAYLREVAALRGCGLAPLAQLGNTLHAWREEIAWMWHFSRDNSITEASIPKWRSCSAKPTGLEISRTIDCALEYRVLKNNQRPTAAIRCVEPKVLDQKREWSRRRDLNS